MRCWKIVGIVVGMVGLDACGGGDATTDGAADAPVSLGCTPPGSGDTFDAPSPCMPWGTPNSLNATLTQQAGELHIATMTGIRSSGGCERAGVAFTAGGAITEAAALRNATGKTFLQISGGGTVYAISVTEQMIGGSVEGEAPGPLRAYDSGSMRWWRIRPGAAGGVVFETSPDGMTWTQLHATTLGPPATVDISLGARVLDIEPQPGLAIFTSVNECPNFR